MSETPPTPPPPAWQPGGGDPKAEAKAAKAYAKAQRPWYKKKRFIIPLVVLALIVIGTAMSSGGSKGTQTNDASSTPTAPVTNSQKESPGTTEKAAVADNSSKGKGAITWGNWEVVGRLQVTNEDYTHDFAVVTRVRNTGKSPDEGLFTVTILKGQEVLGTANCFTSTVQPGAVATAKCSSTDKYQPGYTEVTIEDAF